MQLKCSEIYCFRIYIKNPHRVHDRNGEDYFLFNLNILFLEQVAVSSLGDRTVEDHAKAKHQSDTGEYRHPDSGAIQEKDSAVINRIGDDGLKQHIKLHGIIMRRTVRRLMRP